MYRLLETSESPHFGFCNISPMVLVDTCYHLELLAVSLELKLLLATDSHEGSLYHNFRMCRLMIGTKRLRSVVE